MFQSMGYGSRAINLLSDYYRGKHLTIEDEQDATTTFQEDHHDTSVIGELFCVLRYGLCSL